MVTPPTPNYDYDVKQLVKAYEDALKEIQAELQSLMLTDFKRAQVLVAEKQIQSLLSDLSQYGNEWASASLTTAATEGVASTILALGAVSTMDEALSLAKMSQTNRRLVDAAIADTQADLLAVTQNMNRQAKLAIRKATAQAMRQTLARGDNATSQLSRAVRNEILKTPDMAIIDAAGRRWKVGHYADVIAKTNMMNAHREASMVTALEEGAQYGRISRHGATDACSKYEGIIVKLVPDAPGDYLYIDDIPRKELFHPNCKHLVTPVRTPDDVRDLLADVKPDTQTRELSTYELSDNLKIGEGDNFLPLLYNNKTMEAAEDYIGNQANRALKGEFKDAKKTLLEMRYAWVDDSNSKYGKAIENYFAELYGLPYRRDTDFKLSDVQKAVLQFDHDDVVSRLRKKKVTYVKVYRGVSWSDDDDWLPSDKDNMTLTNRALTSWTTKKEVAEAYADYVDDDFWGNAHTKAGVIEALVPIENIAFATILGDTDELGVIGDIPHAKLLQVKEVNGRWRKRK